MKKSQTSLYEKHHLAKGDERLGLFLIISDKFFIKSALYPGSYVHLTPSFVFRKVVYLDLHKKAKDFFNSPEVHELICEKKIYNGEPVISFHHKDYRKNIGELEESFDLLISQYSGFISHYCKKYLKMGGILLVNDSHGDASMASVDKDYEFIGVINRGIDGKYKFSDKNLDTYFIPKKPVKITKKYLKEIQKGIEYTKSVRAYIFKRIN